MAAAFGGGQATIVGLVLSWPGGGTWLRMKGMEQHLLADDIETGNWGWYGHLGQWVITVIEPCARVKDGTWELTSVHRKARYSISMLFTLKNRVFR